MVVKRDTWQVWGVLAALTFWLCGAAGAQDSAAPSIEVELIAETNGLRPGRTHRLGVLFAIEKGWHLYWTNPGEAGIPPAIDWGLPAGWRIHGPRWPAPRRFDEDGVTAYGYEGNLLLVYELMVPKAARRGTEVDIGAEVFWLACRDICVDGSASPRLRLPIAAAPSAPGPEARRFRETALGYPSADHDWIVRAYRRGRTLQLDILPGESPPFDAGADMEVFPVEPGLVIESLEILTADDGLRAVARLQAGTDRQRSLSELEAVVTLWLRGREQPVHALRVAAPIVDRKTRGQETLPATEKGRE